MPTIPQLPAAQTISAADEIPISQNGSLHSVAVGTLFAQAQPVISLDQATLLGRVSLGPGGPEEISVGAGLLFNGSTLQANALDCTSLVPVGSLVATNSAVIATGTSTPQLMPLSELRGLFTAGNNVSISTGGVISATVAGTQDYIATLPTIAAAAAQDLIGISQAGTEHAISYVNLINGQTIDTAQPAAAVSDGDSFWVAQGSNIMVAQTFSAIWPWVSSKIPSRRTPVVEITANTTLDGTVHNGRILICSQPVILTPITDNMGSGFNCEIVNLSTGTVSLSGSVVSSSGVSSLASGQAARLYCLIYSGGTVVYAAICNGSNTTTSISLPGQVSSLAASGLTSNGVTLSWQAPTSGGAVASYTVQYRAAGTINWSVAATNITGTTQLVPNLTANTSYDFSVLGVNAGGLGPISAIVTATTPSPAGSVASIVWNVPPSGSYMHGSGAIGVNAHVTPPSAAIQFGFSTSVTSAPVSWTAGSLVNTNLWGAYVPTPASAGIWYAWAAGVDGSNPTVYSTPFTVT
jgi:hypothetical protein